MLGGLLWTAANSWSVQAINLGVFVLLARLLEPSAFGLVAMAGVFVHIFNILVDQGLPSALIQREELEPEHSDTAFWLVLCFGCVLTAAGILLSHPIARAFRTPELQPIVALLAWNFLIHAFSSVQQALLSRAFQFKLLALRSFGAAVVGGAVAVVLALMGFGPRALVAQVLATSLAGVVLLWSVAGWRPRLRFSRRHARELLGFGVNVVGIRLLNATSRRSDDLLIGYFLGPVALGYYTIAYKIFKVMVEVFTKIVSRVALPAFASVQADHARASAMFCQAVKLSSLLSFPMFVGVGVLAPELVPVMFGERWMASVPVMQVLSLMGMLQAVHLVTNQAIIGMGRPGWAFRFLLVTTVLSVGAFVLVVPWGIVAVAAAYTAVGYLLFPVYLSMLRRLLGLAFGTFFRQLRSAVVGCLGMGAAMLAVQHFAGPVLRSADAPRALLIAAAAAAGALVYVALVLRLEPAILGRWRRPRVNPLPEEVRPLA